MCKCSTKKMKDKQEDEVILDAIPDCNVPMKLVVPHLNDLKSRCSR